MTAQGTAANETGNALEAFVENACRQYGVHIIGHGESSKVRDIFDKLILEKHVPYQSIYGTTARSEFVLHDDLLGRSARIECRWQESSGSVDEKFPYLYLNAVERMPENEIVFLVAGGGAKKQAVNWLRVAVNTKRYGDHTKTILVQDMEQFQSWLRLFCKRAA